MLEDINSKNSLFVAKDEMRGIKEKIMKGEALTDREEGSLERRLFGAGGGKFRDAKHRDKLIEHWWIGAKILDKRFKEEEAKNKIRGNKC